MSLRSFSYNILNRYALGACNGRRRWIGMYPTLHKTRRSIPEKQLLPRQLPWYTSVLISISSPVPLDTHLSTTDTHSVLDEFPSKSMSNDTLKANGVKRAYFLLPRGICQVIPASRGAPTNAKIAAPRPRGDGWYLLGTMSQGLVKPASSFKVLIFLSIDLQTVSIFKCASGVMELPNVAPQQSTHLPRVLLEPCRHSTVLRYLQPKG